MEEQLPYSFIFEQLHTFRPCIKPVFGGYSLYKGGRMLLFLRKCNRHPELNGIYVATQPEHYQALHRRIPSPYHHTSGENLHWIFIPEQCADFEKWGIKICNLIVKESPWIGRASF